MRRHHLRVLLSGILVIALVAASWAYQRAGDKGEKGGPEITTSFKGHSELVYSVAFSQDGKFLATASFDNTVKLFEAATGKEVKTFGGTQGHTKMVLCVALSPDGQMIASGSADNTLKMWDVPLSTPLRTAANNDAINGVSLSPDGKKIASAGKDGLVKIWDAADFKELAKLEGHVGPVTGVAFNANGQVLVSGGADKMVRFWNTAVNPPTLIAAIGAHTAGVNAVTFNGNNAAAYSVGDDGLLKFWTVPPVATKPLPPHTGSILSMALSADGNQIVTGGADKTVRQSLTAGKDLKALTGPTADVTSVALHPQNTLIAAGSADSKVYLWNAADGKAPVNPVLAHGGAVTAVGFNPQGNQLLTAGADGLVKFWAVPFLPARALVHPDGVLVAVPSGNGQKLYTGSADKIVRIWDTAKGAIEKQFTGHTGPVSAVAASGNGQVLVSGGSDGSIRFWNQAMGKEAESFLGHTGAVTSLVFNAADNQLLSAGEDGRFKVWQLPPVAAKGMTHPDQVTSLAVSPDGAKMVTGGADKIARLWVVATGAKERDFTGPTLGITSVAFSADGKIAAGSADKTVTIWNAGDAKALQKIAVPAIVNAVAFSPDSKTVAVGLADNAIKLFNVGDGKEAKAIAGHTGPVTGLVYSVKGDLLYSSSGDKTVQAWSMPDGAAKDKIELAGPAAQLALSKDGARLAVIEGQNAKVFNLAKKGDPLAIAAGAEAKSVAFSPDGTRLVIGTADKLARIFDADGQFLESFVHDGAVTGAAFLDAKRVVTASADKLARQWTSALIWQKAHAGPVRRAIFTPKGDQVISAGDDKVVKISAAADGKEVRNLAAHEGPVVGLSLSTDGTKLATAGADKSAKVWNLAAKAGSPEENKPAAAFTLADAAQTVSLSPNGLRLAVAVGEKESNLVRVFDLTANREIQAISDHAGPVKSLVFLADNRTLVSASNDKNARLLDVGVLSVFEAHPGGVTTAQLNAAGTQLLTAGADKTVKLWDLAKNVVVKTFGPLPDAIAAATYNRDFTQVGAASGKTVKTWLIADGKELPAIAHPADVLSLSYSVDKTKIVTGTADKVARIFDVATGKELQFFPQDEAVKAVVFSPGNTTIVAAGGKTPRLETLVNARVIVADNGPTYAVATIPANTHVLTGGTDKEVRMWNIATGVVDKKFPGAADVVYAVAAAKNAQFIAAAGKDGVVRVYNPADAKELGNVKTAAPVKALAFTPNSLALAACCEDKNILAWSTVYTAGQPMQPDFLKSIQNFTAAEVALDITFAADNAAFFTGGLNKALHQWKLAAAAPTKTFAHPNNVDAIAFQPNGPLFATGCHDGKLRIFDYVKGLVKEINAHTVVNSTMIYQVVFTADGKQVLSASYDNSLKLFDVTSGNLVREFKGFKAKDFEKGHQESVFSAAFSPDGKLLASGSGGLERVIKIWNVADGTVLRDLANPNIKTPAGQPVASHPGWIYNLRFSKDGKYLISAGDAPGNKGYLAVWNPNDGKLLYGEALPLGTFFGLALSPTDAKTIAIGAGPRGRPTPDFNSAFLMKLPMLGN